MAAFYPYSETLKFSIQSASVQQYLKFPSLFLPTLDFASFVHRWNERWERFIKESIYGRTSVQSRSQRVKSHLRIVFSSAAHPHRISNRARETKRFCESIVSSRYLGSAGRLVVIRHQEVYSTPDTTGGLNARASRQLWTRSLFSKRYCSLEKPRPCLIPRESKRDRA